MHEKGKKVGDKPVSRPISLLNPIVSFANVTEWLESWSLGSDATLIDKGNMGWLLDTVCTRTRTMSRHTYVHASAQLLLLLTVGESIYRPVSTLSILSTQFNSSHTTILSYTQ